MASEQAKKSKEKAISLTKYVSDLTNRLNSNMIGQKYVNSPETYREWLKLEIKKHTAKIDKLKLEG